MKLSSPENPFGGEGEAVPPPEAQMSVEKQTIALTPEQTKAYKNVLTQLKVGYIDRALEIAKELQLPQDIFQSPEVQSAVKQWMLTFLERDYIDSALKIVEDFQLSQVEVQSAAKQTMLKRLKEGYIDIAIEIVEKFQLPQDILQSPEVQSAAKQTMLKRLKEGYIDIAIEIVEKFQLPQAEVQSAAKQGMLTQLKEGYIDRALKIVEKFQLPQAEVQSAAKQGMLTWLERDYIDRTLEIVEKFQLPQDIFQSPEIQSAAKQMMLTRLEQNNIDYALKIIERFQLPQDILQSPEIQSAAKKRMLTLLEQGDNDYALNVAKKLQLSQDILQSPEVQSAAKQGLIAKLEQGSIYSAFNIAKELQLQQDILRSPEVQSAAKQAMLTLLEQSSIDSALNIANELQLPQDILQSPEVQSAAKQGLIAKLEQGSIDYALKTIEKFQLQQDILRSPEVQSAAKKRMLTSLEQNNIDYALKIIERFQLPQDILQSPEVEEALIKYGDRLLESVDLSDAFFEQKSEQVLFSLPGVEGYALKAASHYSVAKKLQSNPNLSQKWFSQYPALKKQVEETVEKHDEQGLLQLKIPALGEPLPDVDEKGETFKAIVALTESSQGRDSQVLGEQLTNFKSEHGLSDSAMYAHLVRLDAYIQERHLPKPEAIHVSRMLGLALKGDEDTLEGLGVVEKKHVLAWHNKISERYGWFMTELSNTSAVKPDEKKFLKTGKAEGVRLRDLQSTVCDLVARWVADEGHLKGEKTALTMARLWPDLPGVLEEAFAKYLAIYEIDIPLYDKLYEEFDDLRSEGRTPLEVYLGRDGIYAYVGRKAQRAARRGKDGDILELRPKYLRYPRNYRDYLSTEVKREYLAQEQIHEEHDPLYYDTGFTGSIPEQIMQITGFAPEEIEKRIRLLSAASPGRRVRGIGENARSEIVNYIEGNVKSEEAAFAIVRDAETGRLRPLMNITSSKERLMYSMVKQALARHYWFKEKTQGKTTEYVELVKEEYVFHVLPDQLSLLPTDFTNDPLGYCASKGELLKGDAELGEAVYRLPGTEGAFFIAKQVNLKKMATDEHEFRILKRAQALGLPTAEPIGFLRFEDGRSFTLMGQVDGRSGRNLREALQKEGKISEEGIETLIQEALERLRELAALYREKLNIDKPWRLKDCIVKLDESGHLQDLIPIDWERAHAYNPDKPHSVKEA